MRTTGLMIAVAATSILFATVANAALVISKAATQNVNCAAGVCTATAADAVLNVKDLRAILQHGPLTIVSGSAAQDIEIDTSFHWTQRHHLTLDAFRSILFREAVISEARGAVTLTTNDGGSGGDYCFTGKGKLAFWDLRSILIVNGATFTLVNDIKTLASDIAANPSGSYALARGYDASVDGTYAATPIPTPFVGTLAGLGHSIANLSIHRATAKKYVNTAFFDEIAAGGIVRDFTLDNASIAADGRYSYIGGLAALNEGAVSHGAFNGSVSSTGKGSYTAGLVGWSTGTVSDSNTSGSITSVSAHGRNTAGLVGRNEGTVTRSSSNATVKDRFGACGLVGDNYGTVRFSSATGPASISDQLKGENPYGAGLVCGNFGTINQSFATGAVQGGFGREGETHTFYATTGGLVSYNQGGLIEDSYAFGAVNADGQPGLEYTGGLAGRATGGTIATSYSTGLIASPDTFGGLIGWGESNNAQSDTYWDLDTSGVSDPSKGQGNVANEPGIKGLTDAKLKSGLPAGFDPAIWGQSASINNGYPYLLANPPP